MADVKQILVVDDHFEMLEFLRSMLELSNKDHQVLAVPSAEEGLLELRLTHFDLLITDLRLPGMSGFDLVKRAKELRPDMPIIMITAYSSDEGRKEATDLGVYHYFQKPLDTDRVLTVVQRAIYGEPEPVETTADSTALKIDVALSVEVRKRMDTLRSDTGAKGLILCAAGQVLYQSGSGGLDSSKIATVVARNMVNSSLLLDQLGGDKPFTLLYQTGNAFELYSVNIGSDYFVILLFDVASRRGRIGTVWVFVQRATKDLAKMLPDLQLMPPPTAAEADTADSPAATAAPAQPADTKATAPSRPIPEPALEPIVEPEPEPIQLSPEEMARFEGLLNELDTTESESVDLDNFWDSALSDSDTAQTTQGISLAEAQQMGLIAVPEGPLAVEGAAEGSVDEAESEEDSPTDAEPPPLDEAALEKMADLFTVVEDESGVDLDDFWDTAVTEGQSVASHTGISIEEARQRGLIPTEFDEDE